MSDRERPSAHGAIVGETMAQIAQEGRERLTEQGVDVPDLCMTCAFREGCMTNMMAGTLVHAMKIVAGTDDSPFGCHHGLDDNGMPTKYCVGYITAKAASRDVVEEAYRRMGARLDDRMKTDAPDLVREAFDLWVKNVDPNDELDDYQRARLYAKMLKDVEEKVTA